MGTWENIGGIFRLKWVINVIVWWISDVIGES